MYSAGQKYRWLIFLVVPARLLFSAFLPQKAVPRASFLTSFEPIIVQAQKYTNGITSRDNFFLRGSVSFVVKFYEKILMQANKDFV